MKLAGLIVASFVLSALALVGCAGSESAEDEAAVDPPAAVDDAPGVAVETSKIAEVPTPKPRGELKVLSGYAVAD